MERRIHDDSKGINSKCFFMVAFQKDCGLNVVKGLVDGDSNLSRIYGFILYTKQSPYVAKVLRDNDFWESLDSISGANWPIFAARPLEKGQMRLEGGGKGSIGFMVQTWEEPIVNKQVLDDFGIENTQDLPLFVAFMWDDSDNLNSVQISIRGNDVDTTYHSIKEIVKTIADAETAILPKYKGTVNVFREVKAALDGLDFKYKVKSFGRIPKRILEFVELFS